MTFGAKNMPAHCCGEQSMSDLSTTLLVVIPNHSDIIIIIIIIIVVIIAIHDDGCWM
jgi:hypothetical protein